MRVLCVYLILLTVSARAGFGVELATARTTDDDEIGQVYNFHLLPESTTARTSTEYSTIADDEEDGTYELQDALDCCEQIDNLMRPGWRAECDFKLKWDSQRRLTNLNTTEAVPQTSNEQCEDLTPEASCVLRKMGLLNEFGFINHFEMKDKIRRYSNGQTSYLYAVFSSAFLNVPFYKNQCDSPRRLFNLLDAMLLVCHPTKRRSTRQCNKMFTELRNLVTDISKDSLDRIVNNPEQDLSYHVSFLPTPKVLLPMNLNLPVSPANNYLKSHVYVDEPKSRTQKNVRYDFGVLGLLGSEPPVTTLDLKPDRKTLVLLPVYQRMPKNDPLSINSLHNDGVLRG